MNSAGLVAIIRPLQTSISERGVLLSGILLLLSLCACARLEASSASAKQQSLNEWRNLTAPTAPAPRVFVKGDQVRFYFPTTNSVEAFHGHWSRLRVPTSGYRAHSALLHWEQKLTAVPKPESSWREATVIAGVEWRRLATNLIEELAPTNSGHGVYYQAFLADRLIYRDHDGMARSAPAGEVPAEVVVDRRYSIDETLEAVAVSIEGHLARSHGGASLFAILAPNSKRFTQALLLDRRQRRCVFLAPASLYDWTERGSSLSVTAQGFSALLPEGHGWALIKNPVSSAARLADLGIETLVRFIRCPLPRITGVVPELSNSAGMDLTDWESWLDRYTGTRREFGTLQLLIDGDGFFPRFEESMATASNHIHLNVYIFDRDDVAVQIADELKKRGGNLEVKVILDRMGSLAAGTSPPSTPLPEDFVAPSSIFGYLEEGGNVRVRPFLNPWLSSDHSKVLLVDGARAWLGGMNLGREYRYEWHDMMVEVSGPVVASLETEFRHAWAHAGALGDFAYFANLFKSPEKAIACSSTNQTIPLRLLPTKTAWKPFASAVFGALRRAQNHIYVENPYLFDKRIIQELVRARERGVEVRVVLPRANDFKAGGRGNLVIANYLLAHGVTVYFYPGMTHVKALLVDGWACVGSANLNHLSLRLNQEQNIATSDPAFAASLKKDLFEADWARCYKLTAPISVDWVDFLADLAIEGF
ncbi:MAG TPA: phosphatidylserine/phosphatidylglycerophosphate/cardiolipin synthase family protein [Candidatus Limnocylindrales bacterium]|nr:phosphatidylserine/phosphatidylglycerophosphate/cardiolipin synthase family protein [Candidatus Limnocylindrales bacterium]